MTQDKKLKKAAYMNAYRTAHRDEIKAKENAYRTAHKEEVKAKDRAYYMAHQEEIKARRKAYYTVHSEETKAKRRAYYIAHREEVKARGRAYNIAHQDEVKAKKKIYRAAHREEVAAYDKTYRIAHKEEIRAKKKAYYITHREEERAYRRVNRKKIRARWIEREHGLSRMALDALLEKQGDVCAICGTAEWGPQGPMVDHDHITGQIRGILCHHCNAMLGFAKDRRDILSRAAEYIERYNIGWAVDLPPKWAAWIQK